MGFYPVCPGTDEYVIGSPLFDKITMSLENGNTFEINAKNNSKENIYINRASLFGNALDKNFVKHADILKGGKLEFEMSNKPNYRRGISKEAAPYSMSKK